MKYICLGYIEDKYFTGLSPNEQQTFMDNFFESPRQSAPTGLSTRVEKSAAKA